MNWLDGIWRRPRLPLTGRVNIDDQGIAVQLGRKSDSLRWCDISVIEVGRQPTVVVEIFFVVLTGKNGSQITVDDRMDGFAKFESAVIERWPNIHSSWQKVFLGSPAQSERTTIWLGDSRSY